MPLIMVIIAIPVIITLEKSPDSQPPSDWVRGGSIPATIGSPLRRKLSVIDAASSEKSLFAPRSNHYERLQGNLEGWSSIRVSIQWRLIFQWRDGHAFNLYLDPHKY